MHGGSGVIFSFNQVCDPVHTPSNGTVLNSKFFGIYGVGIWVACTSSLRIVGNEFTGASGQGLGIQGDAPFLGAVTGLTVEGNYIHDAVIGIEFRGVTQSTISNNIVSGNSAWGIAIRQSLGCLAPEPGWECFYSNTNVISDNDTFENRIDLYHCEECTGNAWERNTCQTKEGAEIPECTQSATHALLLIKSGSGSGRIISNPSGIDCGSDCFYYFSQGDSITLSAVAEKGSTFTGWSGSGCSGTGNCTVNMDASKVVSAAFQRDITPATVTTTAVSSITANSASSGGNISSDGGATVTERGVCWSTATNPTISDSRTIDGICTGSFTSSMTGLNPGTTYHVRAYATNSVGTAYGSDVSFRTDHVATLHVCSDGICGGKDNCHATIQSAVSAAQSGSIILLANDATYSGALTVSDKSLTIQGGWDTSFGSQSGTTKIQGAPKAQNGSVTMQEVNIVP